MFDHIMNDLFEAVLVVLARSRTISLLISKKMYSVSATAKNHIINE
jgi:hypothetical protein